MNRAERRHRSRVTYERRLKFWQHLYKKKTVWYKLKNHPSPCGGCHYCRLMKLLDRKKYKLKNPELQKQASEIHEELYY